MQRVLVQPRQALYVLLCFSVGRHALRYKGVPPYAETQEYVKRLARLYKHALHPYPAAAAASGTPL